MLVHYSERLDNADLIETYNIVKQALADSYSLAETLYTDVNQAWWDQVTCGWLLMKVKYWKPVSSF